VLAIDTLLAVAEDSREPAADAERVWVAMDARMDEIYAAQYGFERGAWAVLDAPLLITPEALNERWQAAPPQVLAGNAVAAFGARLRPGAAQIRADARPTARAMLPLARALWLAGGAVDAALALPLYLRDKVAQTSAERAAARLAKMA
jgi:tRNA threonylcarbamoyladenosine biosynthesis protein TsaB